MPGFEALLTGRTLADRYRIEEVIGRGGMGAVYRATDERLGRPVAVKVITAVSGDAEARERLRARFRHEAASAARLPHHPNVVPVYDYGTDEALGLDFIVMELLRGDDLATRLQRAGPPPMGTALRILQAAARGVAVGHRSGLVHRDVKPGNIFLVQGEDEHDMQVRVLDFGIAKVIADQDTQTALTHDGRAPLSPAYAAPEQLRGDPRLAPASDVFSLGAVGYQLLTGEKPYTEADRNRLSLGMEVPLPSVRARNPAVPPAVEEVVRQAMALDPAARYPHAGALADALEPVIRQLADTPAAAQVPVVAGPVVTSDADDDRTALAGASDDRTAYAGDPDDRTMLAPPRPPVAAGAAAAGAGAAGARPAPVIPPSRRRQEAHATGAGKILVWVALLFALGAGGLFAWQSMNGGRGDEGDDQAVVPNDTTLTTDTTVQVDSLGPDDALAFDLEGRRMIRSGDYAAAADYFQRALQIQPRNAEFLDHYGLALVGLGRHAEAEQVLQDAVRLNPNLDVAYLHLYQARLAQADSTGAADALERLLANSLNPDYRRMAQDFLDRLRAPAPVVVPPPPIDTVGPRIDTLGAPRDTIRIRPGGNPPGG